MANDLEWLNFEPDSNNEVVLVKEPINKDRVGKDGNSYTAHYYNFQFVGTGHEFMTTASNSLHEKIQQTGATPGCTIIITRVGKGKTDTRWMVKAGDLGNFDQAKAAAWAKGDPSKNDKTPAKTAGQPAKSAQVIQPAPQPQQQSYGSDVYVPKGDKYWEATDVIAEEDARRRRVAYDAVAKTFEDVWPEGKSLTPAQQIERVNILTNLSAPINMNLIKQKASLSLSIQDEGDSGDDIVTDEVTLTINGPAEQNVVLAGNPKEFLNAVAMANELFRDDDGNPDLKLVTSVTGQFGFTDKSHYQNEEQRLNLARIAWFYADQLIDGESPTDATIATVEEFVLPPEVVTWPEGEAPEGYDG